ncbi:DUF2865 domain-containing protein [Sinorhizobium saheli]|uniref:DUF2865 domain-containing protein n=1 Tax=Sinorhizobium saheli TaxID=36856 RepID=A0A178YQ60_SINSA|nr:DUF2865 domain-containing protein [Sinorhizobium saheli]OAP49688.1 hypothetical protein ATB98_21695 [Sinorhizobium saheli]
MRCIAAGLAPLLLATAVPAAASDVCSRLSARLADLSARVTTNASLRDFTGAVSRQNIELRRAKNDRRRMDCSNGSVVVIGGTSDAACAEIDETIARMEENLRRLKAQRQQLIGGNDEAKRQRILAAMEINDCSHEAENAWSTTPRADEFARMTAEETDLPRNILRDLPPDSEDYPLLMDEPRMDDFPLWDGGMAGSLRTMCVRTCDGAFFPISSNATPADFGRDAELCRARCPGAETELYYHELATEETDQMVSASTGRPYTELPTAFAYRSRDVGTPGICGCQPAQAAETDAGEAAPAGKLTVVSPSVVTLGDVKKAPPKPVAERPYDPANSKVRVVGPTFLPKEESAIDLEHPLGPRYQPVQGN